MPLISQIDLISDIMAAIENHGVKGLNARRMNAIIDAANLIVDAFAKEHQPAMPGSGWRVWIHCDETGASSRYMLKEILGVEVGRIDSQDPYPHDADDFGRCIGLLDAEPEIREMLYVMNDYGPQWAAIVERWDELERLYREGKRAEVSKRLREIVEGTA